MEKSIVFITGVVLNDANCIDQKVAQVVEKVTNSNNIEYELTTISVEGSE